MEASMDLVRGEAARKAGIVYLDREQTEITTKGIRWKVYGSPAAPRYAEGAFQYTYGAEGEAEWARIPPEIEILLTHTPPHGTLDMTSHGVNAGCPALETRLAMPEIANHCRLHVFGHIHEAYGAALVPTGVEGVIDGDAPRERVAVNAAAMDSRQAIIVDLKKVGEAQPASSDPGNMSSSL